MQYRSPCGRFRKKKERGDRCGRVGEAGRARGSSGLDFIQRGVALGPSRAAENTGVAYKGHLVAGEGGRQENSPWKTRGGWGRGGARRNQFPRSVHLVIATLLPVGQCQRLLAAPILPQRKSSPLSLRPGENTWKTNPSTFVLCSFKLRVELITMCEMSKLKFCTIHKSNCQWPK